MRRWIFATVGIGIVAATVLIARQRDGLPDAALYALQYPEINAARTLMLTRSDTVRAWSAALTRAQSLAVAATAPRGSQPFVLETRGGISAGTREAFTRVVERELGAIGTPRVPIRVLLVADTSANYSSYAGWYLRPAVVGEPCIVIVRLRESPTVTLAPRVGDRRLGVCALYARHGLPGPGIAAWLDSTRAIGAKADTVIERERESTGITRLAGGVLLEVLAPAACLAGRDDACETAVFDPASPYVNRSARRVHLDVAQEPRLSSAYPYELSDYPSDVTAALRAHLGPERFARWWQSDLPPVAAYERITGEPFAPWARAYVGRYLGARQPGPLHAGLPLVLGLLLAAGLAWYTVRGTRRARS